MDNRADSTCGKTTSSEPLIHDNFLFNPFQNILKASMLRIDAICIAGCTFLGYFEKYLDHLKRRIFLEFANGIVDRLVSLKCGIVELKVATPYYKNMTDSLNHTCLRRANY